MSAPQVKILQTVEKNVDPALPVATFSSTTPPDSFGKW
jgi:hypothetical protein